MWPATAKGRNVYYWMGVILKKMDGFYVGTLQVYDRLNTAMYDFPKTSSPVPTSSSKPFSIGGKGKRFNPIFAFENWSRVTFGCVPEVDSATLIPGGEPVAIW